MFCLFDSNKGRIECNSLDSDNGLSRGKTDCTIDRPIFRSNTKVGQLVVLFLQINNFSQSLTNLAPIKNKFQVFFIVSYGIGTYSQLDRMIFVTANATRCSSDQA